MLAVHPDIVRQARRLGGRIGGGGVANSDISAGSMWLMRIV